MKEHLSPLTVDTLPCLLLRAIVNAFAKNDYEKRIMTLVTKDWSESTSITIDGPQCDYINTGISKLLTSKTNII